MKMETALNIHFAPLLPEGWILAAALIGVVLFILAFLQSPKNALMRAGIISLFLLALMNPSLLQEKRIPVKDVAVVVADRSPSQTMKDRAQTTDAALAYVQKALDGRDNIELRVIEAPTGGSLPTETQLFGPLDKILADVPPQRRAGVILITDGQVHDIPRREEHWQNYGPVHVLLTGDKNETDRQLKIVQAPAYGIVGQTVEIIYKVIDTETIGQDYAQVVLNTPDGESETLTVPVNEDQSLEMPVDHAGQNVFELFAEPLSDEITVSNNRAAVILNGVRDRMKVLLVSGRPHPGTRTWRDLLTSDPGVDLVHFTILREPDKLDITPQHELSLIAFPFRELFEVKLYDFDLIIFDRYQLNRILPDFYFNNIVKYVEEGGALLVGTGPDFASEDSIYYTPLMNILPGTPNGDVINQPFIPSVTKSGLHHPVTFGLTAAAQNPSWGHWFRQVDITRESGEVLMQGANEKPLLILDRVAEGRVAQIASDHIWLWHRGYEGGGPHAELLRRIVHWLMKEPELDEKALTLEIHQNQITIRSRSLDAEELAVEITKPDETAETLSLLPLADGSALEATIQADQLGIWQIEGPDGQRRFAVIGNINPRELQAVRATSELLEPLARATGGGILWLGETPKPSLHMISAAEKRYAGRNWIGLRMNGDYTVAGAQDKPLLPAWAMMLVLLGSTVIVWIAEGRRRLLRR